MENYLNTANGEMTVEQRVEINIVLTLIKNFAPDIAKHYPKVIEQFDKVQREADEYLGSNEKMVVGFRIGGKTRVVVLDTKKEFNISNTKNPSISTALLKKALIEKGSTPEEADSFINSVSIPAKPIFEMDPDAIILNEGVRAFIENKILGNSAIKYILDNMKEEYEIKYKQQEEAQA